MPSEDTFKFEGTAQPTLQQHVQNQKFNVGVVKKQVGMAFTYPNIHYPAWFFEATPLLFG